MESLTLQALSKLESNAGIKNKRKDSDIIAEVVDLLKQVKSVPILKETIRELTNIQSKMESDSDELTEEDVPEEETEE